MIPVIIQARSSSSRLPGKVMKKIGGITIVEHTINQCSKVVGRENVILATSDEVSDNDLADHVKGLGITLHRGSLENVYERFSEILRNFGIEQFVRICADSPFLNTQILNVAIQTYNELTPDLVTNVFPRTFPKGQSVEIIKSKKFLEIGYKHNKKFSTEHITQSYYNTPILFDIVNIHRSKNCKTCGDSLAVDTDLDYKRVKNLYEKGVLDTYVFEIGKIVQHLRDDRC